MQTAAREIVWGVKPKEYWGLCIVAEEPGAAISMSYDSMKNVSLEYSRTGSAWFPFIYRNQTYTVRLENVGDRCYFRAASGGNNSLDSYTFKTSKKVSIKGKISSLLNKDVEDPLTLPEYAFKKLFGYSSITSTATSPAKIVDASELILPTVTSNYCYQYMFNGCTSLVNTPELPATSLATGCYQYMFYRCTSLVNAPELPATTLAERCYNNMFNRCTSLINAPELPATTLAYLCYSSLFYYCNIKNIKTKQTSFKTPDGKSACSAWVSQVPTLGTFECPSALGTNETIERGTSACPSGWTVKNI